MAQQSMRDKAYLTIREWLHTQKLPKGTVSSEVQLSQRLEMSRTPVRAALQQLELEGYVRIIPKHGILILESSAQRVGDLLDLVCSLVLFAFEHNRMYQTQLTESLLSDIQHMQSLISTNNLASFSQLDLQLFHRIVAMSRNSEMERLFVQSTERLHWQQNTRRWKAPFLNETEAAISQLLNTLTTCHDPFLPRLFAYFQLLKRTWI